MGCEQRNIFRSVSNLFDNYKTEIKIGSEIENLQSLFMSYNFPGLSGTEAVVEPRRTTFNDVFLRPCEDDLLTAAEETLPVCMFSSDKSVKPSSCFVFA